MSGQTSPRFSTSEGEQSGPGDGLVSASPVLAQLSRNLELLSSLGGRQEALTEAACSLQADLLSWTESVRKEVKDILDKYPLEVASSSVSAIDDGSLDNDSLPSPIKPQVFAG